MSRLEQLIREIHRRSLWQVLGIYLAASWAVLQVVQTLTESLDLPGWFPALAIVLLLVGLPIILATAFLQQGIRFGNPEPRGGSAEPGVEPHTASGGEPEEPAPTHLGEGLRALFTWRNALAGGVLAFAAWGVVAAAWLLFAGAPTTRPIAEADDVRPDPAVAVLPFSVRGGDLDVWREGMVDLLSTALNGVAGLRAIDSRTLLARWNEHVSGDGVADQATALEAARATGARYGVLGSAISVGSEMRLVADVYDLSNGGSLGSPQVEGAPDSVLTLVDRFAVETALVLLEEKGGALPNVDLASVTTSSVPALRAWLDGESAFRRAEFDAATAAYERAIQEDSTFALAHYRLAVAYGWAEGINSEPRSAALKRAARWIERLPAPEAVLVRAARARDRGSLDGVELLRGLVKKYPDHAQAWYDLGDTYLHMRYRLPVGPEAAERAFRRAVELDPNFPPSRLHLIHLAFLVNPDSERAGGPTRPGVRPALPGRPAGRCQPTRFRPRLR